MFLAAKVLYSKIPKSAFWVKKAKLTLNFRSNTRGRLRGNYGGPRENYMTPRENYGMAMNLCIKAKDEEHESEA